MAYYYNEPSRTFNEYLLIPNLTNKSCIAENVLLKTPIVKFKKGETSPLEINLPLASAIMQSVSDHNMSIALARCGGISFIFGSQSIEDQASMVSKVKKFKAGFVVSDSNLKPVDTLNDVINLKQIKGHSTIAITEDGTATGKLLGIVTSRDYRMSRTPLDKRVSEFMTPFTSLIYGKEGITLKDANDMIWDHKLNCLPIVDEKQNLVYFVFRKDYDSHKEFPNELLDNNKSLITGAGINTRDYLERVPALVEAGADIIPISPLDGGIFPDIDALYIGGGFPETHAEQLAANGTFNASLRERIDQGLPVYAECGGLIYLSSSILIGERQYPMTGVFPMVFEIASSPQGHGYTVFSVDEDNPFYVKGAVVRGHEFRYARIVNQDKLGDLTMVFSMKRGTGIMGKRDGALYRNTLATFCHTHALSENVTWPEKLVKMALARI